MAKHQDLTGMKFGRLTVLKEVEKEGSGDYKWLCQCDCGNVVVKSGNSMKSGNTKSCGCIKRELLAKRNRENRKWDIKNDRIHRIWGAMRHRCYSKNDVHYDNYGGKGITICDEWLNNFEVFQEWALSNGYSDNLTIDRIDGNKGYCPENCRWATQKEQANNFSRNKVLEYRGETHTLSEWCEILGLNYGRTKARINSCGWTVKEAFESKKYEQVALSKKK